MLKPHAVTVYPVTDFEVGSFVEGRDLGEGVSVRGMLQPKTADYALRTFGLDLRMPHVLYVEEPDAFKVGYLVVFGERKFVVRGLMHHQAGGLSHVKVGLEEVTHALVD